MLGIIISQMKQVSYFIEVRQDRFIKKKLSLMGFQAFNYRLLHFHLSHMAVHHHLLHHLHDHHLHLLLLVQSFTLNLRLGSSANHFPHRPFPFLPD